MKTKSKVVKSDLTHRSSPFAELIKKWLSSTADKSGNNMTQLITWLKNKNVPLSPAGWLSSTDISDTDLKEAIQHFNILNMEEPMKTKTEVIKHVPDIDVPRIVDIIIHTPGYVSHKVIPEGNGMNTIEAVYKVKE
jgi:hypothetical protein